MTIVFTLDQEEQDTLDARVAEYNSKQGVSLTAVQYLEEAALRPHVTQLKQARYAAAVNRISTLASKMSYADRLSLIAMIESQAA